MKRFDRFIGIDAGKGGGIAHAGNGRNIKAVKMPETVEEMQKYLSYIKEISECPIACIEKVGLWRSDANDGRQFGIEKMTRTFNELTTVLRLVKIPFIQVYPVQWQAYLNLRHSRDESYTDRKGRFKEIAQVHFPEVKVTLHTSDALLIMEFIALKVHREPEWIAKQLPESILRQLEINPEI